MRHARSDAPGWSLADTAQTIPHLFGRWVAAAPEAPAITGTSWQPSYAQLDAAANRLAREVIDRGGPVRDQRVTLLMRHDAPLVGAVLAVQKAGRSVIALNPADPPLRLRQVRQHVRPERCLVDDANLELARAAGFTADQLIAVPDRIDDSPCPVPPLSMNPDQPALLYYTSGSTGASKAVLHTHRTALHAVMRNNTAVGLKANDGLLSITPVGAAAGLNVVLYALMGGARLCMFSIRERGLAGLARWMADECVSVYASSTSVFRHFVRTLGRGEIVPGLRLVRLGGEPVTRADFEAFRDHFQPPTMLANMLASSEAPSLACALLTHDSVVEGDLVPVGRPTVGVEIRLLDDDGCEVAPGQTGEIAGAGGFLSPGYFGNPALTAERFIDHPRWGRMVLTRDLGRWGGGGLSFVGRRDARVKVRGSWVDPGEVELALEAHPDVADAAVGASRDGRGDVRLTAVVTPRSARSVSAEDLRRHLLARLPGQAVPTVFSFAGSLPRTASGKIDRKRAVALVDGSAAAGRETEAMLTAIWARAFGASHIDAGADFFELGGDSLTAAVIAADISDTLGVEIELRAFVEQRTVAAAASYVDRLVSERGAAAREDAPRPVPRSPPPPLPYAQERVWRNSRTAAHSAGWTTTTAVRLLGPLDEEALRHCLVVLGQRHEVLRTTYTEHDGEPVQIVHPRSTAMGEVIDVSNAPSPREAAAAIQARQNARAIDLEQGPVVRHVLLRLGPDEHRLVRVGHHIAFDGPSWRIFFEELATLYADHVAGRASRVDSRPALDYVDYAVWERRRLDPGASRHRRHLAWWQRRLEAPVPRMALPFERERRGAEVDPREGVVEWSVPRDVDARLDSLGRAVGATHLMTRIAVFCAQLAVSAARTDLVVGLYVDLRRTPELRGMFGMFTNLVTLRLAYERALGFRPWLARVRDGVLDASAHAELPYDHVVAGLEHAGRRAPQIDVICNLTGQTPPMRFAGIAVAPLPGVLPVMPWGFSFLIDPIADRGGRRVDFDANRYDPDGVRGFVSDFERLAVSVCDWPDRGLGRLTGG